MERADDTFSVVRGSIQLSVTLAHHIVTLVNKNATFCWKSDNLLFDTRARSVMNTLLLYHWLSGCYVALTAMVVNDLPVTGARAIVDRLLETAGIKIKFCTKVLGLWKCFYFYINISQFEDFTCITGVDKSIVISIRSYNVAWHWTKWFTTVVELKI